MRVERPDPRGPSSGIEDEMTAPPPARTHGHVPDALVRRADERVNHDPIAFDLARREIRIRLEEWTR